jgi:FHA domain-containing protein
LPQAIPPTEFGAPDDPVLSWKNESDAARAAILPPAPAADPAEIAAIIEQTFDARRAEQVLPSARPAAQVPGALQQPGEPAQATARAPDGLAADASGDLLRALLLGLGLAELPRAAGPAGQTGGVAQPLTPEVMRRLGELLAAASDGTVALLQARGTLKQQLRADVTMIGASDNNPLKFVPDGQSALNQLLSPHPARGFMAPRLAMRDAYDDLLAHQIGFVAGMRAALQGLIARFDPAVLEGRLAGKSVLESLLPAARKARLWELFGSLYAEVSREAEDDFERLFGRAFVTAYEEQIARIAAATAQQPVRPISAGNGGVGPSHGPTRS